MVDLAVAGGFVAKVGSGLVVKYISPVLEKVKKQASQIKEETLHKLNNAFEDYIDRSFQKYSYISTLVFPNQQRLLEELYISLTLVLATNNQDDSQKISIPVTGYPKNLIPKFKDVLVVDNAGMGKSTVLRYLFLSVIHENIGIPVFIELRKLSKEKNIESFIFEEVLGINEDITKHLFHKIISEGEFIFFLDGYDEIQLEHQALITEDIQNFKKKANKNSFIMASRDEDGLTAFPDFKRFHIELLKKEEDILYFTNMLVQIRT